MTTMIQSSVAANGQLKTVDAPTLKAWLEQGQALLVDVREPAENAAARIAGSLLAPLSSFDPAKVPDAGNRKLVVHCKSGMRSLQAGKLLVQAGRQNVFTLAGGIEAWQSAGYPIAADADARPVIDVQRQVFLVIGPAALLGAVLGALVSSWWCILPAIVGLGLIGAGLTGFCPLAVLMAKMPWNQRRAGGGCGGGGSCRCGDTARPA